MNLEESCLNFFDKIAARPMLTVVLPEDFFVDAIRKELKTHH